MFVFLIRAASGVVKLAASVRVQEQYRSYFSIDPARFFHSKPQATGKGGRSRLSLAVQARTIEIGFATTTSKIGCPIAIRIQCHSFRNGSQFPLPWWMPDHSTEIAENTLSSRLLVVTAFMRLIPPKTR